MKFAAVLLVALTVGGIQPAQYGTNPPGPACRLVLVVPQRVEIMRCSGTLRIYRWDRKLPGWSIVGGF